MSTTVPQLAVGDRVKLAHGTSTPDRFWWTARATDERFTILTRQRSFRQKGRLVYTIIDRERGVRGPCNLLGQGYDVEAPGGCERLLAELQEGTVEVSHRNNVAIAITRFGMKVLP